MAERRMFAKTIIDSDAFLDMPLSAQALYFHLSMRADDEGFINNPKKIQRVIGGSDDDLKLLIAKKFVIPFESGIVVIKHWKIHNYIRKDRLQETVYQEEKACLTTKDNGTYTLNLNECQSNVSQMSVKCQHRLGKDRLGKDSIVYIGEVLDKPKTTTKRFVPPTIEEVEDYVKEKGYENVDAEVFVTWYDSKGWYVGKNKMKNWKSAVAGWNARNKEKDESKIKYKKSELESEEQDLNELRERLFGRKE